MKSRSRRAFSLALLSCLVSAGLVTPAFAATTPAAPTGIKVTTTASSAVVTWNKAKDATKYKACLQEWHGQTSCSALSDKIAGTSWTFKGLHPTAGRDYYVKVYSYRTSHRAVSGLVGFDLKDADPPAVPTSVTHTIGTSTLTISWAAAAGASAYMVCLMTAGSTETCSRTSPRSATRTATFSGLRPTVGTDYYYRVYAYGNGSLSSHSSKYVVDLPVATLSSFTVPKVRTQAFQVAWPAATNAETYTIQVATSSTMTSGLKTFTAPGDARSFSVTGLTPGSTYYTRIRGVNGVVLGGFSPVRRTPLPTDPVDLTVVSYNLCGQDHCRSSASAKQRIKPWATRKPLAGKLVRDIGSDLIATQESHDEDTRFITELPGYSTGAYYSAKTIFYKTSRFTKLGSGVITLDAQRKRYAVWNRFLDKSTRTPFYFVDTHLEPYKGKAIDDLRAAQTKVLIAAIVKENTSRLPVIYAGDYNSNKSNAQAKYPGGYDAPLRVFSSQGIVDGYNTARLLSNEIFNSANQALNPPLKHFDHVDHIFVTPSIGVRRWRVVLTLRSGNYPTPFATDHNPIQGDLTIPGRPGTVG